MAELKMSPLVGRLCALVAAVAIAGCGGPMSSPGYRNPNSRGFAQDVMARGPLPVVVQGTPYAQGEARTTPVVLDNMRRAMFWTARPQLIADPALQPTAPFYVVMTFNAGAMDPNVQCTIPPAGGGPQPGGAVQVAASFCGSGSLISSTSGWIDGSTGLDDPAFGRLVTQVTTDLFPTTWQPQPGIGFGVGVGSGGWSGGGVGVGVGF